jgi:hypothetical protein
MEVGATGERTDDEACRRITAALKIMLIKQSSDIASSEISDKSHYLNGRQLLSTVGMATTAGAAGLLSSETLAASSGATPGKKLANVVKSAFSVKDEKLNSWDDITSYNNVCEFGVDKGDALANSWKFVASLWKVANEGERDEPGVMDLKGVLKGETLEERVYRHRCVEAWSMAGARRTHDCPATVLIKKSRIAYAWLVPCSSGAAHGGLRPSLSGGSLNSRNRFNTLVWVQ